jgi:hypothetical protein
VAPRPFSCKDASISSGVTPAGLHCTRSQLGRQNHVTVLLSFSGATSQQTSGPSCDDLSRYICYPSSREACKCTVTSTFLEKLSCSNAPESCFEVREADFFGIRFVRVHLQATKLGTSYSGWSKRPDSEGLQVFKGSGFTKAILAPKFLRKGQWGRFKGDLKSCFVSHRISEA